MRSRLLFLVIGLVAGVALTSGAVWANGYRTHVATDGSSFSAFVSETVPAQSYTYAAARVCKEGQADVKITDVRIAESVNHIEVIDYAVVPSLGVGHRVKGNIQAYLDADDTSTMTRPKTTGLWTRCTREHDDLRDVIVEMRVPDKADLPAVAIRFVIEYTVRGHSKSLTSDTGITFCRGDQADKQLDELVEERPDDLISTCD